MEFKYVNVRSKAAAAELAKDKEYRCHQKHVRNRIKIVNYFVPLIKISDYRIVLIDLVYGIGTDNPILIRVEF